MAYSVLVVGEMFTARKMDEWSAVFAMVAILWRHIVSVALLLTGSYGTQLDGFQPLTEHIHVPTSTYLIHIWFLQKRRSDLSRITDLFSMYQV